MLMLVIYFAAGAFMATWLLDDYPFSALARFTSLVFLAIVMIIGALEFDAAFWLIPAAFGAIGFILSRIVLRRELHKYNKNE